MKPTPPATKLILGLLLIAVGAWIIFTATPNYAHITNYDQCVAAGFPVLKSYPGQCVLPNGTKFIQPIMPVRPDEEINSFETCMAAGYPISNSTPRNCKGPTGSLFVEGKAPDYSQITNFEECAAAGYPIMESYPRQCRPPGGPTFVEEIKPSPGPDASQKFVCATDSDCRLIKEDGQSPCCGSSFCGTVDYSTNEWIAVNTAWHNAVIQHCSVETVMCEETECAPTHYTNTAYVAQCEQNVCQKQVAEVPENLETATEGGDNPWSYYTNIHDEATCTYLGGLWATSVESGTEYRCLTFG